MQFSEEAVHVIYFTNKITAALYDVCITVYAIEERSSDTKLETRLEFHYCEISSHQMAIDGYECEQRGI